MTKKRIVMTDKGLFIITKGAGLLRKAEGKFLPFTDGFETSEFIVDVRLKRIRMETFHSIYQTTRALSISTYHVVGTEKVKGKKKFSLSLSANGRIMMETRKENFEFPAWQVDLISINNHEVKLMDSHKRVLKTITL